MVGSGSSPFKPSLLWRNHCPSNPPYCGFRIIDQRKNNVEEGGTTRRREDVQGQPYISLLERQKPRLDLSVIRGWERRGTSKTPRSVCHRRKKRAQTMQRLMKEDFETMSLDQFSSSCTYGAGLIANKDLEPNISIVLDLSLVDCDTYFLVCVAGCHTGRKNPSHHKNPVAG
jgi:hypothetical protein